MLLIYMLEKVAIETNKIYNLYLNIVNTEQSDVITFALDFFVFICKALESIFTIDVDTE